jgi:hypothetical protein
VFWLKDRIILELIAVGIQRVMIVMIEIRGKVIDFDGNPIEGADVRLKDRRFEDVCKAVSDAEGKYGLQVKEGTYVGMYACKDYGTKNLEFWAWNVPAYQNLEVNPRFDGLELYAMNAWMPQGAYPSLQVYFRPMSLRRMKDKGGKEGLKSASVIDIAPKLAKADVAVKIDDQDVTMLEMNEVKEAAGPKQSILAHLIQTALPKQRKDAAFHRIQVTIIDTVTGEKGEGVLFWKTPEWV